jgi:hypothetical protein
VGNKSTNVWHTQNWNETNILENGFLDQFILAQRNLQINQAAGVTSFQNLGRPGQSGIPIFETAFGANGSQGALTGAQGFTNATYIQNLQQGSAGTLANTLANTNNNQLYCRLVGANFAPCAAAGFTQATPYPMNFFRPNPFANNLTRVTSDVNLNYNGLQIELRKARSHGVTFQFSYVWSHTLGGFSNESSQDGTDQWQTLRNGRLDYGPTPFDRRHNFTTFWTWDVPVGKGRRLNVSNPILHRALGGWTIGGIHRFISGSPSQLTGGRNTFNQFADGGVVFGNGLTAQKLMDRLGKRTTEYIASCQCFMADVANIQQANGTVNPNFYQPGATPGAIGAAVWVYGRWGYQNDLSVTKEVRITEKLLFGIQGLAFNVFNHPYFNRGSSTITGTGFGQITGVTGDSRAIRRNNGSAPPSVPNTKLGRSRTCSIPEPPTACSAAHLARKYGTVAPGPVPSALISTMRRTPLSRAASTRLPVPAAMTRSNVFGAPSTIATRCTIVRTPRAAARSDARSVTSPRTSSQRTPSSTVAPRASRTIARTGGPSVARSRITCRPTNPLAPVTRIIVRP